MKVFTLGPGFVADHLPYPKIKEKLFCNEDHIDNILSNYRPDVLINCIGKTGRPNIDQCEVEKLQTYQANVIIPLMVARWCEKHQVHMINMASGCIFNGNSPNFHHVQGDGSPMPDIGPKTTCWTMTIPAIRIEDGWRETDLANPQSYYSKSKYACDLVLGELSHITTLRLRMPISEKNVPRNLINKLRGYNKVISIPNSMTFMSDLVRCVEWAVANRPGGIYHVVNPQPLTAARIMQEFQKYVPEHQFQYISEQELDQLTIAKRSNCLLSTQKLTLAGFEMTNSEEALMECMAKYVKNMEK